MCRSTGIVAESLTPQLAAYFGAKAGEGVLVRNVDKGSAAEKAGLKAGDVITRSAERRINDRSDVRRLLRNKAGNVPITVLRDKREQTFTLTLPEQKQSGKLERRRTSSSTWSRSRARRAGAVAAADRAGGDAGARTRL